MVKNKFMVQKKILVQKNFWSEKNYLSKTKSCQKNFVPRENLKNFGPIHFFGLEKVKFLVSKKKLWSKTFFGP